MASTAMVCMAGGTGLLFGDLNHFAALVLAAVRANAMGQLGFVAVGAVGHSGAGQVIMGPPHGGPPLGMSSFWIWHLLSQLLERCPAVITRCGPAAAFILIAVLPAFRTDPLALIHISEPTRLLSISYAV